MTDITEFLVKQGYKIEYNTVTPKGRGRYQYNANIDKKPSDEDIDGLQDLLNVTVLKNNFKKGIELTLLIKKNEVREEDKVEVIQDMNLDMITDMIYKKDLSYQELKDRLNMFQNSAYTKGFNAHKEAIKKLLNSV